MVSSKLYKILLDIERINEYVSPYTTSIYAFRALKRLSNLTGIKVNPYMLRKTCASLMVKQGKNPYLISRFMGHISIETTNKHYVKIELTSLRELI
jgi:integrase